MKHLILSFFGLGLAVVVVSSILLIDVVGLGLLVVAIRQGLMLQVLVSSLLPLHSVPPPLAGVWITLNLDWTPPPHVAEQELHLP